MCGPQVLCWLRCRRRFICFVAAGAFFVLLPPAFFLFVTLPQVLSLFRCRMCFLCFVAAGASFICFVSFSSSTRPPGRPPVRPGRGGNQNINKPMCELFITLPRARGQLAKITHLSYMIDTMGTDRWLAGCGWLVGWLSLLLAVAGWLLVVWVLGESF